MNEMTLYRNALVHEVARWQADPDLRDISDPDRDLQAFETLWRAFAQTGIVATSSRAYAEQPFPELDEKEQADSANSWLRPRNSRRASSPRRSWR